MRRKQHSVPVETVYSTTSMIERLLSAGERQPVVPVSACITTVDGHRRNNKPVVKGRGEGWQYYFAAETTTSPSRSSIKLLS